MWLLKESRRGRKKDEFSTTGTTETLLTPMLPNWHESHSEWMGDLELYGALDLILIVKVTKWKEIGVNGGGGHQLWTSVRGTWRAIRGEEGRGGPQGVLGRVSRSKMFNNKKNRAWKRSERKNATNGNLKDNSTVPKVKLEGSSCVATCFGTGFFWQYATAIIQK